MIAMAGRLVAHGGQIVPSSRCSPMCRNHLEVARSSDILKSHAEVPHKWLAASTLAFWPQRQTKCLPRSGLHWPVDRQISMQMRTQR